MSSINVNDLGPQWHRVVEVTGEDLRAIDETWLDDSFERSAERLNARLRARATTALTTTTEGE